MAAKKTVTITDSYINQEKACWISFRNGAIRLQQEEVIELREALEEYLK